MGPISPVQAEAEKASLSEVWSLEDNYWRFVKAGDVESYRTLWHESFIGWPCHEDHPVGKSAIGNWVQEIRDKKVSFASELTREGAQEFGSVVIVHYRLTMVSTYPDGHVEGLGQESKITHTWMKVGNTWQIIGGMCGRLTLPGT
jgi:ketosteroid isomerase-like protein